MEAHLRILLCSIMTVEDMYTYIQNFFEFFFFFFVLLWKLKQGFLVTSLEGEKPSFPRNKK